MWTNRIPCPVCMGPATGAGRLSRCNKCRVVCHLDCRHFVGACPTFGCEGSSETFEQTAELEVAATGPGSEEVRVVLGAPTDLASGEVAPEVANASGAAPAAPVTIAPVLTCPVCRGAVADSDELVRCLRCEVVCHDECRQYAQVCPTYGCVGTIESVVYGEVADLTPRSATPPDVPDEAPELLDELDEEAQAGADLSSSIEPVCLTCGAEVRHGDRFCWSCGVSLKDTVSGGTA